MHAFLLVEARGKPLPGVGKLPDDVADLVTRLMVKHPRYRLGVQADGAAGVLGHAFLASVDQAALTAGDLPAPHVPVDVVALAKRSRSAPEAVAEVLRNFSQDEPCESSDSEDDEPFPEDDGAWHSVF